MHLHFVVCSVLVLLVVVSVVEGQTYGTLPHLYLTLKRYGHICRELVVETPNCVINFKNTLFYIKYICITPIVRCWSCVYLVTNRFFVFI